MKGHVTPAATVKRPRNTSLAQDAGNDSRLCRCLRCDAWIDYELPTADEATTTELPDPNDLPTPLRGQALDARVVIRAIAIERGLHVVFFLTLAVLIVVVEWGLPGLREGAEQMLEQWKSVVSDSRPGQSLLVEGLQELSDLDSARAALLLAATLAYAALEGTEAIFLWKGKRWAEYLTVVATAALLPLAIQALTEKVTVPRIAALTIDLAILAYLVWVKRLFGIRGGNARMEAELASDVDWDEIHAHAPTRPASQAVSE